MAQYVFNLVNSVSGALSSDEQRWQVVLGVIQTMKGAGWFTRGSSIYGTSGTTFSATPDSTDRWAGKTVLQAIGAGNFSAWHVLEHTAGHQACVSFGRGSPIVTTFTVAKNKFETAGAWRNAGSVTANVRPADTTSSPALDREVAGTTITPTNFLVITAGLNTIWHCIARDDGQTVYCFTENPTAIDSVYNLWGLAKMSHPSSGNTNPWVILAGRGGDYNTWSSTITNVFIRGVTPLVASQSYGMTQMYGGAGTVLMSSGAISADPFSGKFRIAPIGLWTDNAGANHTIFTLPDLCSVPIAWAHRDPINSLQYMKLGGFGFPWDGITSFGGTARVADFIAMDVEGEVGSPGISSAFWLGQERL